MFQQNTQSRQQLRRELFQFFFGLVTSKYGGEPRAARRKIARNLMKRKWAERQQQRAGR